jgi:hypothetical protein
MWVARGLMIVVIAVVALAAKSATAGQNAISAEQAVVLVTTYADGRTVHHVVTKTRRHSWTPMFPRLRGHKPAPGELPVRGLNYRRVLADDGAVSVDVSVLRGDGHESETPVATVVVREGQQVSVDALASFGVMPVTFKLTSLSPTVLYPPRVLNRTAGLEVLNVEAVYDPGPRYQVTVKNVSSRPAVNFHFIAHHGGQRALSGTRGNPDSSPIIEPNGTYSFALDPPREAQSPSGDVMLDSLDVIEIDAVLWEDGDIEGDPASVAAVLALYVGRATQLARAVALFKTAQGSAMPPNVVRTRLREGLHKLSTTPDAVTVATIRERLRHLEQVDEQQIIGALRTALASVRKGVIEDLDDAPDEPAGFWMWMKDIVALYAAQAERLARR